MYVRRNYKDHNMLSKINSNPFMLCPLCKDLNNSKHVTTCVAYGGP